METAVLLLSSLAIAATPATREPKPYEAVIELATVTVIEAADVPAMEAGQLTQMDAREQLEVTKGQHLASLDKAEAEANVAVAKARLDIANAEAENVADLEVAVLAEEVTQEEWQRAVDANHSHAGTVTAADETNKRFEYERSKRAVMNARLQKRLAELTAHARKVELAAAETALARRQIEAPFDGLITDVHKRFGEWVEAGEQVVTLMRVDRLRVEGHLDLEKAHPSQIDGQPAVIVVTVGPNEVTLDGHVAGFRSVVVGKRYRVWAEVSNRKIGNQWLLLPGMKARVKIQLKPFDAPAAAERLTAVQDTLTTGG